MSSSNPPVSLALDLSRLMGFDQVAAAHGAPGRGAEEDLGRLLSKVGGEEIPPGAPIDLDPTRLLEFDRVAAAGSATAADDEAALGRLLSKIGEVPPKA